ncbi:addiction module protein [Salegentibacter sp. JZCK2]|uniref:addiction module protein n=1 Tax=Salegentibacter tibetensis TaxID=2873600 RepID=UPI001CCC25DB|nr:addiction module protein [Salegentibacter tibetensis]MBZ9730419.1 addiction module protein [Salegentibacter tibetensis]
MMDINALKIQLMQKIIACNDDVLLKQIGELLQGVEVKEPEKDYEVESHKNLLSKEQLEELDRRLEAYKSGTEKAIPWEEAKREIEKKYGF